MDVLLRFGTGQLFEDFVHFLPLPEDRRGAVLQLKVNVVGLPEARGEILEATLDDPYNFLTILIKIHLDLFELIGELRPHLHINLLNIPLIILGAEQSLDQILGDLHLIN